MAMNPPGTLDFYIYIRYKLHILQNQRYITLLTSNTNLIITNGDDGHGHVGSVSWTTEETKHC